MRALHIALYGTLAVSTVGLLLLRDPAPIPASEQSAAQFQAFETPVPEAAPVISGVQVSAVSEVEKVQKPVQTIEERGDAMLFEGQALLDMPFDQAIVMPFD